MTEDATGGTILLADGNADMREHVTRLLAGRFRVHATSDGEAALRAAQENASELVLADIRMPGLDDMRLRAPRADARTREIPIILLSAQAGEESEVEVLADDVLEDPAWERWRWLAAEFDDSGCSSFPIHTSAGAFVGTVAVYSRQPRSPSRDDLEFIGHLTQVVAIIISRQIEASERQQIEAALRESEARLRALVDPFARAD